MSWWNQYVGLPFLDCGRDRTGADCYGLIRLVLAEQKGIILPLRENEYSDSQDHRRVAELISGEKTTGRLIETKEPQDLDVVVFKVGGLPCHLGIICGGGKYFLHVIRGANSVIERLSSIRWNGRIESYWRAHGDSRSKDSPVQREA